MQSKSACTFFIAFVFLVVLCYRVRGYQNSRNVGQWITLISSGTEKRAILLNTQYPKLGYLFYPTSIKYTLSTGYTDQGRIVGGSYARDGQFPFMAVVHRLMGGGAISQCGGSIISKRWVLTAGHCVNKQGSRFFVVFGIINKSGIGYDFYNGPGVSMMTTKSILHPQYQKVSNDIALLYMPRDIPFSSKIQPITLSGRRYASENLDGRTAYVIGWGRDEGGSSTQGLKYATLPVLSNNECRQYWAADQRNICTPAGRGEDACQGDSGGPLIVMDNGRARQIGIVSYGDENCPSNKPGVFTKVSAFAPWIQSVTRITL